MPTWDSSEGEMFCGTSDHDAAQLRLSQGADDGGALRLHQVLHHQEAEETHACLQLSAAERRRGQRKTHRLGFCRQAIGDGNHKTHRGQQTLLDFSSQWKNLQSYGKGLKLKNRKE